MAVSMASLIISWGGREGGREREGWREEGREGGGSEGGRRERGREGGKKEGEREKWEGGREEHSNITKSKEEGRSGGEEGQMRDEGSIHAPSLYQPHWQDGNWQ